MLLNLFEIWASANLTNPSPKEGSLMPEGGTSYEPQISRDWSSLVNFGLHNHFWVAVSNLINDNDEIRQQ